MIKMLEWSVLPLQYIPPNIREIYLEKNKGYIINLKQKSFSLSLLQPLY